VCVRALVCVIGIKSMLKKNYTVGWGGDQKVRGNRTRMGLQIGEL